jgi:hypothetical protein
MAWPDERAAVAAAVPEDVADDDTTVSQDTSLAEPTPLTRATYEEAPPPAQDYPSLGGGVAAEPAAEAPSDGG